jgi:amino acid transporter
MVELLRKLLVGARLPTERIQAEKVGKLGGLAVFASDALSSVAYGPEEILLILVLAGAGGLRLTLAVSAAIAVLVIIVATSYRQTIIEYPSGGGAYVVARDNLGMFPAAVAGGALLTDYVLTVAVSVSAGVAAITSALPHIGHHNVGIGLACVAVIMVANLRGARESAAIFAAPVYAFVGSVLLLIVVGLWRIAHGLQGEPIVVSALPVQEPLTLFLVLRAFASGCAALTGIEAVANGVQAFRAPAAANAARVLSIMATLLAVMVLGTSYLAHALAVTPSSTETVVSRLGGLVFGYGTLYYILQAATALILILAANTSFADFPRLAAFMAQDGYVPRQFTNLGDRLVYSNGIVALALLAGALIWAFGGEVTRLIPLYAVGVFTAFTMSQSGMVLHWLRRRGPMWAQKAVVNGVGATVTGIVLVVIAVSKFVLGAWVVMLVIPGLVLVFRRVRAHYGYVASRLTLDDYSSPTPLKTLHLLLAGGVNKGSLEGLRYLRSLQGDRRALHIHAQPGVHTVEEKWRRWVPDVPLVAIYSPFRTLAGPLLDYIAKAKREEGYELVIVILPEFVVHGWWESLLHNHTALWLQLVLRRVPDVAIMNVRYHI